MSWSTETLGQTCFADTRHWPIHLSSGGGSSYQRPDHFSQKPKSQHPPEMIVSRRQRLWSESGPARRLPPPDMHIELEPRATLNNQMSWLTNWKSNLNMVWLRIFWSYLWSMRRKMDVIKVAKRWLENANNAPLSRSQLLDNSGDGDLLRL